jgi:cyanophycin synthetase
MLRRGWKRARRAAAFWASTTIEILDESSDEEADMEFRNIRALRGPNIWTRCTALEVAVDLGEMKFPVREIPGFELRLRGWLPAVYQPAAGQTGDKVDVAVGELTLAHVLERVALRLQNEAGVGAAFCRTAPAGEPGIFKVIVEYREEEVGRAAVESARSLIEAAVHDGPFDVLAAVQKLRALDQQIRLGPSTGSIVRAASSRGIPARRLNDGSLVQFGWGSRQHRILAAETDRTSAIGESIAQDKELTKNLLKSVGVPVPEGRPVKDAEQAWAVACEIGLPVVVKPNRWPPRSNRRSWKARRSWSRNSLPAAITACWLSAMRSSPPRGGNRLWSSGTACTRSSSSWRT